MKKKIKYSDLVIAVILAFSIGATPLICNLTVLASNVECCQDRGIVNAEHHDESAIPHHEEGGESHPSRKAPDNCCKNWVLFARGGNEQPGNHLKLTASDGFSTTGDQASLLAIFTDVPSAAKIPSLRRSRSPDLPLFLITHTFRV